MRDEGGFVLIAALAALFLVALIVGGGAAVLAGRIAGTGLDELRSQALLAAQTGVGRAVVFFARNGAFWEGDGPDCADRSGYDPLTEVGGEIPGINGIKFPASVEVAYRPGPPDPQMRVTLCVRSTGVALGMGRTARRTVYVQLGRKPAMVGAVAFAPGVQGYVTGNGIVYGSLYVDGNLDLLGNVYIYPDPSSYPDIPGYRNIVAATERQSVGGSAQIGTTESPFWGVFSPEIAGQDRIHALIVGNAAPVLSRTSVRDEFDGIAASACAVVNGDLVLRNVPLSLPCLRYTPGNPARLEVTGAVVVLGDVKIEPSPSGGGTVVWSGTGQIVARGKFKLNSRLISARWPDEVPQFAWVEEGEIRARGDGAVQGVFITDSVIEIKGPKTVVTGIVAAAGVDLDTDPTVRQDLRAVQSIHLRGSVLMQVAPSRIVPLRYMERGT